MTTATNNSLSLRQTLDYCLDVLKIKRNSEFYRNITAKFMSQTANVPLPMIKTLGNWIAAIKLIGILLKSSHAGRIT
jgi:hypothetical protein